MDRVNAMVLITHELVAAVLMTVACIITPMTLERIVTKAMREPALCVGVDLGATVDTCAERFGLQTMS